ncbi:F0F1 ATP synthase subunit delta [Dokdonella sp.]|uniref:F0F1 ATP synthase subunit delta n=1 Tax=Dokdonella sp. TaxID=2291710 RepID=UPI0025C3C6EF|nr:F0F1 ATP synthase subunit delta [Dokdonella sp.]MBX3690431.1 F0F1 ATP synthase subunit delta [Dokdonella sp.]
MSSALTLARPYARAAFELARSRSALGEWAGKLAFAAQVAADARVAALFGDPRVAQADLAALVTPADEPADSPFTVFVRLLADNRRLPVLPEIAALFEQLKNEAERTLKVNVRTATPLGSEEAARLKEALKRRFGRDIQIEQSIDPEMLGGAVIDAGDVVIDGSVRGRLARLGQALAQ